MKWSDYELGYTPGNLNRIMAKSGLTNAALAKLLGVNADTICRWRTPLGRDRHADMPTWRWLRAVAIAEADYDICMQALKDKILDTLSDHNLVYVPGQVEPVHLIVRYPKRGKWLMFSHYGPSKETEDYSLEVGLDAGFIDYENEESNDEEIELDASDVHIMSNYQAWARTLMAELGPFSWDGKKVD